jgi:hypothetical protein
MNTRRATSAWPLAITCAAWLASACGGDDGTGLPPALPGQLTVTVSSTGSPGAAFLLTVRGAGIASPEAAIAGYQLYTHLSGDTLKAAIIGTTSNGDLLRFTVPDVNRATTYRVSLQEVAGGDNSLLPLSNFTATIRP